MPVTDLQGSLARRRRRGQTAEAKGHGRHLEMVPLGGRLLSLGPVVREVGSCQIGEGGPLTTRSDVHLHQGGLHLRKDAHLGFQGEVPNGAVHPELSLRLGQTGVRPSIGPVLLQAPSTGDHHRLRLLIVAMDLSFRMLDLQLVCHTFHFQAHT